MLFVKRESKKSLRLKPLRQFEAYLLSLVNFINLLFTISTCITKPKKIQARILFLDVKKNKAITSINNATNGFKKTTVSSTIITYTGAYLCWLALMVYIVKKA